jgi:hypothetical protein
MHKPYKRNVPRSPRFCKDCKYYDISENGSLVNSIHGDICWKKTETRTALDPVGGPTSVDTYAFCLKENANCACLDFEPRPPTFWQKVLKFFQE